MNTAPFMPDARGDEGEPLEPLTLSLKGVKRLPKRGPYRRIIFETERGLIECRFYGGIDPLPAACLWVGGISGGYTSPAKGLYERMCEDFEQAGIPSLRLRFRDPTSLEESALDVCTGLEFLRGEGIETAALIGHSFGGAAVTQAAHRSTTMVRTLVTLSTQGYGMEVVGNIPNFTSAFFIHGEKDEIIPPACSTVAYRLAHEPKRLLIYPETGHALDEVADALQEEIRAWVFRELW